MAAKRMTMRKIREVLRLSFEAGLSIRQIKASRLAGGFTIVFTGEDFSSLAKELLPELSEEDCTLFCITIKTNMAFGKKEELHKKEKLFAYRFSKEYSAGHLSRHHYTYELYGEKAQEYFGG
jgi:hypothetical protein